MTDTELRCQCGCNEVIKPERKHKYFTPRFIRGHQFRNGVLDFPRGPRRYTPAKDEIPSGLCECGCGGLTGIAATTVRARRHFKGHPKPFIDYHNSQGKGANHPNWKGGRSRTSYGYIMRYAPDHPQADRKGYIREHRLVMEEFLGRPLLPTEFVHHINEQKDDNRPENLQLMTKGEHNALHAPERKYDSEKMRRAGRKGAAARWRSPPRE